MEQENKSPLEDVLREVAEHAKAAQVSRRITHEPLMVRIDRDRRNRKRASFVVFAILAGTALVSTGVGIAAMLASAPNVSASGVNWNIEADGSCCLGPPVSFSFLALCVGVIMLMVRRPDISRAARLFSARLANPQEVPRAREALSDMSLAVGLRKPPALYLIDTDSVNAFVVGKSVDACAVGITRGMTDMLSARELRAVFAHLFARVVIGNAAMSEGDEPIPVQADAEAMYLLRDPNAMLSALKRVLGATTTLTVNGSGLVTSYFFAPWIKIPGMLEPLSPVVGEGVEDRVERLRAVLGADGAVD